MESVFVYDVNSAVIYNSSVNTDEVSISSDNWPKGIYLVMGRTSKGLQTVKVVKE